MSGCSTRKPLIVLLENRRRQFIYTMLGEDKVYNSINFPLIVIHTESQISIHDG